MFLRSLRLCLPLCLLAASTTARADERTLLEVKGPNEIELLERARGSRRWTTLCEAPCTTTVLPEAAAEHVLKLGRARFPFRVTPEPLQRITLYPRPPAPAGGVLLVVLGSVTAGVWTLVMLASALGGALSGIGALGGGYGCDDPDDQERSKCEQRRAERDAQEERREKARKSAATGGLIAFGIGAAALFVGVVMVASRPQEKIVREPPSSVRVRLLPVTRAEGFVALPGDKLVGVVPLVGGTF